MAMMIGTGGSMCTGPSATTDGLCTALKRDVQRLSDALATHPETPRPVGEAGTDVVIGFQGGCDV